MSLSTPSPSVSDQRRGGGGTSNFSHQFSANKFLIRNASIKWRSSDASKEVPRPVVLEPAPGI